MSNSNLEKKIKEGIKKSGFPLELKIGSLLEKNNWNYSIGGIYEDFETGKYRGSDIQAVKIVNGISIIVFIECKKSETRQIVLYAPKRTKPDPFWAGLKLKLLPVLGFGAKLPYSRNSILGEFSNLSFFDKSTPFANNLIITAGEKVNQDNITYLSAVDGLIKHSFYVGSYGYFDGPHRSVFLYSMIFDGDLYQLSNSKTEDFDLEEISYGQLEYAHRYQFGLVDNERRKDSLVKTSDGFGSMYVIEFMTPEYFEKYIENVESVVRNINTDKLIGWGVGWPDMKMPII